MSEQLSELLDRPAFDEPARSTVSYHPASGYGDTDVRVVIATPSAALVFGLESLVHVTAGVALHKSAASLEQLLAHCREAGDCVAVVDPILFSHDVAAFMRALCSVTSRARVLLISDGCPPLVVREAIKCGVRGFIEKTAQAAEIRSALAAVARGQRYLGSSVTMGLADCLLLQDLTAREMDVLRLLAHGHCNKSIARDLAVTVGTVKTHVCAIMSKLDARSRTDTVLRAHRLGLVRIT